MLSSLIFLTEALKNAGGEFRFVGGCVRDYFIDCGQITGDAICKKNNFFKYILNNNKDIDIATNLKPEAVYSIFTNLGCTVKTTLVTNIVVYKGVKLEITTLRKDINQDGRWTQVHYTESFEEDSLRRDFTINAIYLTVNDVGEVLNVYDYHGGVNDLSAKIVKFIGDSEQRIKEDYLRILRFFRFSSRFALSLDKYAVDACVKNIDGISILSKERVKDEVYKILSTERWFWTICQMDNLGVLEKVFKKPVTLQNVLKISDGFKIAVEPFIKTLLLLDFKIAHYAKKHDNHSDKTVDCDVLLDESDFIILTREERRFISLLRLVIDDFKGRLYLPKIVYYKLFYGDKIFVNFLIIAFAKGFIDDFVKVYNIVNSIDIKMPVIDFNDIKDCTQNKSEYSIIIEQKRIKQIEKNLTDMGFIDSF